MRGYWLLQRRWCPQVAAAAGGAAATAFRAIELGGRGVPGNQASGRAELVLKHHHGKLRQGPVLAAEQVLEAAGRNIGGL